MQLRIVCALFSLILLMNETNANESSDPCVGRSSGLTGATKGCTTAFFICTNGEVTAVLNCPGGTFFNEKTEGCDYREVACIDGLNGEDPLLQLPLLILQLQIKGLYGPDVTTIALIILSISATILLMIACIFLCQRAMSKKNKSQYQGTLEEAELNLSRKERICEI